MGKSSAFDTMREEIEHVVVLILENRSLDHVLGSLYDDVRDPPQHNIPDSKKTTFDGVLYNGKIKPNLVNSYTYKLPNEREKTVRVEFADDQLSVEGQPYRDPAEPYLDVNQQLFGSETEPDQKIIAPMSGFLQNFYDKKCYSSPVKVDSAEIVESILKCYRPHQLPILNSLARHYAVSDRWFSSVPTQTNANRAFAACGTSLGRVDNKGFLEVTSDVFKARTIWNVLEEHDVSWTVFFKETYPFSHDRYELAKKLGFDKMYKKLTGRELEPSPTSYTELVFPSAPSDSNRFQKIETDFVRLAKAGRLPAYSFLEPGAWGGAIEVKDYEVLRVPGDDYHPPGPLKRGEDFLMLVYRALTANPEAWAKTLLVVTFDEHGGTYDHVVPPWTAIPPWGLDEDGKPNDPPGGISLEHGFKFDRFGVRVPALLISPHIEKGTVFRSDDDELPFDHTSIIATILRWKDIEKEKWKLGERVANAPTFENVLTREEARTDTSFGHPHGGDVLNYGDKFYLRHGSDDLYIGPTPSGRTSLAWYPKLYPNEKTPLRFTEGGKVGTPVRNLAVVCIETLEPKVKNDNRLSTQKSLEDCYWYRDEKAYRPAQRWQIVNLNYPDDTGELRFGDMVQILNQSPEFKNYVLRNDTRLVNKNFVTCSADTRFRDWWCIVKARG